MDALLRQGKRFSATTLPLHVAILYPVVQVSAFGESHEVYNGIYDWDVAHCKRLEACLTASFQILPATMQQPAFTC